MNRAFPRLAAFSLLALIVLPPAAGQRPASATAPGQQQPGSDLSAALNIPGSLQSRFRFEHLTSADGLSNDSVFAILQDHRGFMWFGTQGGLNKNDGYRVTQYRHDPNDPHSLGDDFVETLFEDSRGGIWSGTTILSRFDPDTETFTRYTLPSKERLLFTGIAEDKRGFLWVAGSPGLQRFDPGTPASRGYDIGKLILQGQGGFLAMHADAGGILWLGTGNGLVRFDPATGDSIRYSPDPPAPILGIASDRSGRLWLATTEGAQNRFDPVTRTFTRDWSIAPRPDVQGTGMTHSIYADPGGTIWRGTSTEGIKVFDSHSGTLGSLRYDPADRNSLSGNEVLAIVRDREDGLWVGVKGGGVNRLSARGTAFGSWRHDPGDPNSLSDNNVRAIYGDRAGSVWIGTYSDGLDRFEPKSGKFVHYRHDPRNPRSLDNDRVYSIYEDRSGTLWAGTVVGINRLDRKSGVFEHFSRDSIAPRGSAQPVYSFLEDRARRFWFGVGGFGGWTALLDRSTGAATLAEHEGGLSMLEDHNGNLWLDSDVGLEMLDSSGKVHRVPVSRLSGAGGPEPVQVNYLHEDSEGILWLATETGLVRLDPKTEKYTTYTTREGLPDNVVQCILSDTSGNLWVSTNNGLSTFNPRENSFYNYHESDGLQGEPFNRKSCFEDSAGRMYFGGLHGFNAFDPRQILANQPAPPTLVLTEFQIDGKTVPVRPGSLLPRPIWEMDALKLPYQEHGFSFEFAALSYRDPARTRYRFRLDGLEKEWTEVDSRHRYVRYTDLPPGNYRFYVQASTDGGTWSEQGAALGISIAPPWWMTSWSRGGAILALAGLVFGAFRLRVKAIEERERRLQELVEQRTVELVEARDQAQTANRAKSAFLANMSHELRTPLNAILGFSRLLREDSVSAKQRKDLDIINRSGEHLLHIIDDVLDIAKIEAGRKTLEIAPCDLGSLVRNVMDMMRARAEEKNLELLLVSSPDFPQYIRADASHLRQVLINLLGNAVKYTETGAVTLRLNATAADESQHLLLTFDVEDTGIGIVAEDQTRIFDAFVQAGKRAAQKGTGLGLAITRQLVELMGGTIHVDSTPGKGSRFRVEVPAERAQESEVIPERAEIGRIIGLEPGQPEYRVLVVDDQTENSTVLERLLESAGFRVQVAADGAQGVEMFRALRPHFIWMDLRMSVMDGFEATRRIRALDSGREVKIAAVTASVFARQRSEVLAAGLDDLVGKPYRPGEVFDCMARHLGARYRRVEALPVLPGEPQAVLRPTDFAALPEELRNELRNALISLDRERIAGVIQRVSERNAALGVVLTRHADRFAYTAILNVVESCKAKPAGESS